MTRKAPFTDLPGLMAWIDGLPPAEQVHMARLLGDTKTGRELAALADAITFDMTRTKTRAEVADELGITVRAVQRAISNHLARTGTAGQRGPARASEVKP